MTHINADGLFQSDKYPTCPPDKVPLSVNDPAAQELLWQYAARRRSIDAEFSDDLQSRLLAVGYTPPRFDCLSKAEPSEPKFTLLGRDPVAAKLVKEWAEHRFARLPNYGQDNPEEMAQINEAIACAKAMQDFWTERQRVRNEARIAAEKAAVVAEEPTP